MSVNSRITNTTDKVFIHRSVDINLSENGRTVDDVTNDIPTIYVGYDSRENEPYEVLKYTVKKYASGPINVYPIKQGFIKTNWVIPT